MSREVDFSTALALALRWLGLRSYTAGELTRKLLAKGAEEETAAAVVQHLVEKGYLDDATCAGRWLEGRARRGWGRCRLLAGLLQKGLPQQQADELLAQYLPYEKEVEQALEIARQRWPRAASRGPEAWRTLANTLRCRGYSPEVIAAVRERLAAEGFAALDKAGKRE